MVIMVDKAFLALCKNYNVLDAYTLKENKKPNRVFVVYKCLGDEGAFIKNFYRFGFNDYYKLIRLDAIKDIKNFLLNCIRERFTLL